MEKTIVSFDWAIKSLLRDKANFDRRNSMVRVIKERMDEVEKLARRLCG